jgi:hypothetical protein
MTPRDIVHAGAGDRDLRAGKVEKPDPPRRAPAESSSIAGMATSSAFVKRNPSLRSLDST